MKFYESIGPVYEAMTGNKLQYSIPYDNYWHFLRTESEVLAVEKWVRQQGARIYLRDGLTCSIALDVNMKDVTTGERTALGQLEYNAKTNDDEAAIAAIAEQLTETIGSLPFYNSTRLIVAVPARPGKATRDLPTELVKRIAAKFGLINLTGEFRYAGEREQLKSLPLAERWAAWDGAKLSMTPAGVGQLEGNPIILIDDKYQSGISANFVAMILQQAGASDVYGLYAVKTMRDDDNTRGA